MKNILIISAILLISQVSFSQVSNQKEKVTFMEGQIGLSAGKDIICLNIGGPKFTLVKYDKIQVNFGFYPTLRYGVTNKKIIPALGAGPEIGLGRKNRIGFIAPLYWTVQDSWVPTLGIRYKL